MTSNQLGDSLRFKLDQIGVAVDGGDLREVRTWEGDKQHDHTRRMGRTEVKHN